VLIEKTSAAKEPVFLNYSRGNWPSNFKAKEVLYLGSPTKVKAWEKKQSSKANKRKIPPIKDLNEIEGEENFSDDDSASDMECDDSTPLERILARNNVKGLQEKLSTCMRGTDPFPQLVAILGDDWFKPMKVISSFSQEQADRARENTTRQTHHYIESALRGIGCDPERVKACIREELERHFILQTELCMDIHDRNQAFVLSAELKHIQKELRVEFRPPQAAVAAQLLSTAERKPDVFFVAPCGFGKSLTYAIAAKSKCLKGYMVSALFLTVFLIRRPLTHYNILALIAHCGTTCWFN
jgi:hypothetical protein